MPDSRHLPSLPTRCVLATGLACVAFVHAGSAHAERLAQAEPAPTAVVEAPPPDAARAIEAAWWREGVSVFAALWDDTRAHLADDVPDWLQHLSRRQPAATVPDAAPAYVVLQDDRADGLDLVTMRYRLGGRGPLRAYAGAGLSRTQYFMDDAAAGPSMLTRRNRHEDLGATAELGAEFALDEHVRLHADLRWADLDERADLLHTVNGPVAADPLTFGISLGYRFR